MAGNPLLEPVMLARENQSATERSENQVHSEPSEFVPNHIQNSMVAAIDISKITDLENYGNHIDILIDAIKADGFSEIFIPSEPEERQFAERFRDGIPVSDGTIHSLRAVSENMVLPCILACDGSNVDFSTNSLFDREAELCSFAAVLHEIVKRLKV